MSAEEVKSEDFYYIVCEGCKESVPFSCMHFQHKKDEESNKVTLNFSNKCFQCDLKDLFDAIDKKEYLTHEIYEKLFNSVISQYYTDLNNLKLLLFAFKQNDEFCGDTTKHRERGFIPLPDRNYFKLIKIDEIKYNLYKKSGNEWNLLTDTELYYDEYKHVIDEIISKFHSYGPKVEACEKLLSDCESCEKLEDNKVKICDQCKEKIYK